jgi:hypothetical protein
MFHSIEAVWITVKIIFKVAESYSQEHENVIVEL